MKILVAHLSQSHPLFPFQALQWRKPTSHALSLHGLRLLRLPVAAPRCVAAPSPADSAPFNGWDDLRLRVSPGHLGESNLLRSYLNSLGIDNKKYMIVYVLGFACALAISRVRVPSIVVVPAAVIVFAIGFSFGAGARGANSSGSKRKSKGEDLKVSGGKLRNLLKLFDDFDGRNAKLKDHISEAFQNQRVGVDDLKGYVDAMELMGLCVKKARGVVEECVDFDSLEEHEVERSSNKKANRKRKESGDNGFNWFQLGFSFFQDNAAGSMKSIKKKEVIKHESKQTNKLPLDDLIGSLDEESVMKSKYANNARRPNRRDSDNSYSYRPLDFNGKGRLDYKGEKIDGVSRNGSFSMEVNKSRELSQSQINERFIDSGGKELNFHNNRLRFTDEQNITFRMSEYEEIGRGLSHDAFDDDDLVFSSHQKNAASRNAKLHRNFSGAFESLPYGLEGAYENYNKCYRDKTDTEVDLVENNEQSTQEMEFVSSSSSAISDDILFDKYLTEAHSLLRQAKDCLRGSDNEMHVDQMLHKSTKLLSGALSLKPMSLLATGLLGNTYLLRGELKLRFSQELRYLLSESDDLSVDRWKDEPLLSKDKLVSRLIDVCGECEELLVEAGRKYKMAISIDGNDVRALYNWGVALSFRAQLIADIGPEAASDADKLFLAAIDKFDAMMSRSKTCAPDALYRWAMVLQQRSRLRPRNSKDKVRLLQQAKRLYEDALEMGFDKLQEDVSEMNKRMIEENYRREPKPVNDRWLLTGGSMFVVCYYSTIQNNEQFPLHFCCPS